MLNNLLCESQYGLTRKQQALIEREKELLGIAHNVVKKEGFTGLTMDKVASASAYSKGTVYNHFSSKEDLITALAIMALSQEMSLFKRAVMFDGNYREKLMAVHAAYALFFRLEPALANCILSCRTPTVTEKSSPERLEGLRKLEDELLSLCDELVKSCLKTGELSDVSGIHPSSIVFANWAIGFGANSLYNSAPDSECIKRLRSDHPILDSLNLLLDGVGWKPLSTDFDYAASWQRVMDEIFPEEFSLISQSY
ncbi:TetR/AcrR family transcriptional regulator [Veronia pacifica]|uniref:TetR/AcrR family transcriptional regulator n=1 Tax=Veronia pacifica TaxID=1080227 RepID=UPI0009F478AE|nr:TetR/AcrR family transcriptional regulator [Veronia pacifica]